MPNHRFKQYDLPFTEEEKKLLESYVRARFVKFKENGGVDGFFDYPAALQAYLTLNEVERKQMQLLMQHYVSEVHGELKGKRQLAKSK